jgi:hypothetical protein
MKLPIGYVAESPWQREKGAIWRRKDAPVILAGHKRAGHYRSGQLRRKR